MSAMHYALPADARTEGGEVRTVLGMVGSGMTYKVYNRDLDCETSLLGSSFSRMRRSLEKAIKMLEKNS